MAKTIDERIVQMTFNNQEFEKRANTTIGTLGKLADAINPNKMLKSMDGVQKAANSLDLSGVQNALYNVNKGFNMFEEIAIGACRKVGDAIATYILGGMNKVKSTITSLTTGQISVGFNKYNDLTSSVQTLVNSTGKSVDEIDGYLKRLMWYSDETSFGFTDMTKALGTMVSSGGEIDKLIPMLMGIGNATAYAGKGASEFQRVIYNLNQSYSSGALNTMDWRSIELAGVDSKVLKEQLMGAAVQLKTINKEQAKLSNFKDLLSKKVFNREVMEQAFGAFAQMTMEAEKLVQSGAYDTASEAIEALSGKYEEFAERAFKSAQEAKSFREAIEATQDAVSSGWMQTFQLIFGNYEESKALWTDVTETFWEIFASGAARRNSILEAWTEIWDKRVDPSNISSAFDFEEWQKVQPYMTQTQALVASISEAVMAIRDNIVDVFQSVFPIHTILNADGKAIEDYHHTATLIYNVVEGIRNFFIDIKEVGLQSDAAVALRNAFRAILEVIKTLIEYAKVFVNSFIKPLADRLKPIADQLVSIFNNLSKIIFKTAVRMRSDMGPFETFLTNVLNILQPIINIVEKLLTWINKLLEGVGSIKIFEGIFKSIANFVDFLSKAISGSLPIFKTLGETLGGLFDKIKSVVQNFLEASGVDVSKLAEGGILGYLAYGLAIAIKKLKDFDINDLFSKFTPKSLVSGIGDGIKDICDKVSEGLGALLGKGGGSAASDLKVLADSIMKLALAFLVLSLVDGDKIESSLIALGGVLGEAIASIRVMSGMKINSNAIKALKNISLAIIEISLALKILSSIDSAGLGRAFLALTGVMVELGVFMSVLAGVTKKMDDGDIKSMGKAISKIGFALIEMALALKIMSTLDDGGMKTALVTMGVALAEVAAFVIAVSRFTGEGTAIKLAALGPAMIGMGLALIEVAAAMKLLSTIDAEGIDRTLVALFGALGTIALFIIAITKFATGGAASFVAIAAGMLILSAAIGALTISLIAMSAIGWSKMFDGLKVMAAMLGVIALSGVALGAFSPLLLLAAAAMAAFGGALDLISESVLKAVTAFTLLQTIGVGKLIRGLVDVLTAAFTSIIMLIPSFIFGVLQAILSIADQILQVISTIIKIAIDFIAENLGNVVTALIDFLKTVLERLIPAVTEIMPLLFQLVMAILNGINDGLIANVGRLMQNLYDLLIAAINGLADVVRSGGELGSALLNLATSLIEGLFGAVGSIIKGIGSGILGGLKGVWEAIFGEGEQGDQQEDAGESIVNNVTAGIDNNKQTVYDKASEIGNQTAKEMEDAQEAEKSGGFTVDGLIKGLTNESKLNEIFNAGMDAGKAYMNGYNFQMDQHSPSRMMEKEAGYTLAGLINGLSHTSKVENAGETVGKIVYNAISSALSLANEIMDDSLNPVITPVLDLSEIQARKDAINGLFGSNIAYDGMVSVNGLKNDSVNQNPTNTNNITVNATFEVNTDQKVTRSDVEQWSDWLVDSINTKLGEAI